MTKEEEILKAAEEEFFTNGYEACSTAVIAKRANVTHAMVNYYFRTKERLFTTILDMHVKELLQSLKPLMHEDGNVVRVAADTALAIFDALDRDRRVPYLITDISRTHPEFLLKYKETFMSVCKDSIEMHSIRLQRNIEEGNARECTMNDIYSTVLSLAAAPFIALPILENVSGMSAGKVEEFLKSRRAEIAPIIISRYGR